MKKIAAIILFSILCASENKVYAHNNDSIAYKKGMVQAQEDLKKGVIGYYFCGIVIPLSIDVLEKIYGIAIHRENCALNGTEDGYNYVMHQAIIKKFGKDLIGIECGEGIASQPTFSGGIESLAKFLTDNIKEPTDSTYGTVYINITIDSTGQLAYYRIIKGLSPTIDDECVRVVKLMPKWVPATTKSGERIAGNAILPITFEKKKNIKY
jgi:hypothetical protein